VSPSKKHTQPSRLEGRKGDAMEGTPFLELAEALEKVRLASGKNEKVSILAGLLSRLRSEDEVEYAARFAAGRSTRKGSAEETNVGYAALIDVLFDAERAKP